MERRRRGAEAGEPEKIFAIKATNSLARTSYYSHTRYARGTRLRGRSQRLISNSEMIRIRRQMQRRIHDVVAERRRARMMEAHHSEPAGDTDEADAPLTARA
ncbi:hypothetical protein GCM10027186_58700 [Micromonospora schwarzwaldensis]